MEQTRSAEAESRIKKSWWARIVPLVIVFVLCLAVLSLGAAQVFSLGSVIENMSALRNMAMQNGPAFLAGFAGLYILVIALSLPVALFFAVMSGFFLGPVTGGLVSVLAKTIGSLCLFLIIRYGLSDLILRRAGPRLARIETYINRDSFWYLLCLRLQPAFPFFLVNLAAGLLAVPASRFIAATLLGTAPAAFIYSYAGAGLGALVEQNAALLADCTREGQQGCEHLISLAGALSPVEYAILSALSLIALVPVLVRRLLRSKEL